jgi:hypothetical protein
MEIIKKSLKVLHVKIGKPVTQARGYLNLCGRSLNFLKYSIKRKNLNRLSLSHSDQALCAFASYELKKQGIARIENCLPRDSLLKIKQLLDRNIDDGTNLNQQIDNNSVGNPESSKKNLENSASFRERFAFLSVNQPQLHEEEILRVAISDLIIGISEAYLGAKPSLTGFNLRKSFVNKIPQSETQFYHSDSNSVRFLKFFIYLNDVDENGGPFVYVKGSHKKKFFGWLKKYRWEDCEIEKRYPNDIFLATGKFGDLIVADTTGFHKGLKPAINDRGMLTINVSLHPDFMDMKQSFRIKQIDFENIPKDKKTYVDFLRII